MSSEVPRQPTCTECGYISDDETNCCPQCDTEDPWELRPEYVFNEDDLPLVFSYRTVDNQWGLWRAFCYEYFQESVVERDDIAGLPAEFPSLRVARLKVWYRITAEYEVEGPFLTRSNAVESGDETHPP